MKNLKKILSLVVALVMCLSIATVASAASYDVYPDADEVTYTEAMDVLVALGIIKGDDNGQLNPKATVTREEAAKIITYIAIGEDAAEALTGTGKFFEDVAATRWSAGYIEYCATVGIIDGVGDTDGNGKREFDPTEDVTAYAFVKMLLCAVGYGAQDEFVGNSWAINVASKGVEVGAFDDSQATSYAAAATREEAMLYAFNVMTGAMTVNYSDLFSAYYSGSTPMKEIDEDDEYKYTLGYKNFGLYQGDVSVDDFGREYYEWEVDGDAISDAYFADATLSYTGYVYSSTLYSALGSKYAGYATVIVDGELEEDLPIAKNYTNDYVGGRGVQTFVYADDNTYDVTIVCVNTYLGEVESVDDGVANISVEKLGDSYEYETESFEEGDMVLVTVADDEIQSVELATSFTGVIGTMASSYLTIDGTTYYKSAKNTIVNGNLDYVSTYTFYLDSYGYLLGAELYDEADVDLSNYVYVSASQYINSLVSEYAAVKVTYLDGTTDVLYLNLYTNSNGDTCYSNCGTTTAITANSGAAVTGLENGFYRISTNSSGYVTLKAISTSSQPAVAWTNKSIAVSNSSKVLSVAGKSITNYIGNAVYLNSATELHVIDIDGDVTTVVGYSNIKGYSDDSATFMVFYSGSLVEAIYVINGTYETDADYAYYTGSKYETSNDTYYKFYHNGESVAYTLADGVTLTPSALHAIKVSSGEVVSAETVDTYYEDYGADYTVTAEKVTKAGSSYFRIGTSSYHYYDDDAVIYDATNGGAAATISAGDWVLYAVEDGFVVCAYIVSTPSADLDIADDTSSDVITVLTLDESSISVTASETGTVYVVVEKWSNSGYSVNYEGTIDVETVDEPASLEKAFDANDYRVTVYADADYTEILAREYFTVG